MERDDWQFRPLSVNGHLSAKWNASSDFRCNSRAAWAATLEAGTAKFTGHVGVFPMAQADKRNVRLSSFEHHHIFFIRVAGDRSCPSGRAEGCRTIRDHRASLIGSLLFRWTKTPLSNNRTLQRQASPFIAIGIWSPTRLLPVVGTTHGR